MTLSFCQSYTVLRNYRVSCLFLQSGVVRNADRIWASTPQNRTYRAWNEKV